MAFFNVNNIVAKFNKLQKEVDAYLERQAREVEQLRQAQEAAETDLRKGQKIAKVLQGIVEE